MEGKLPIKIIAQCQVHMCINVVLDNSNHFQAAEVSAKHLPKITFSKAYDIADPLQNFYEQ